MRTLGLFALAAASLAVLGGAGTADPDWASFGKGDPSLDVAGSLDATPDVTIYSALRHLAIETTHTGGARDVVITWDDKYQTFALWLDDKAVTDLVTGKDAWGRPTFAGGFKGSTATISGFADITSAGAIMIDLTRPGHADSRYIADKTGLVAAAGQCECSATYVSRVCVKTDCDANPPPKCNLNDTVSCAWKTVTVAD